MRNPLRDEGAAFRLVLLAVGYFGLIAIGSWIDAWVGLGVFVALTVAGLLALRGARERARQMHVAHVGDGRRRILVVANETVAGEELLATVRARAAGNGETEVLVVCPALNSRLRTWVSDEDGARAAAAERLARSLERLGSAGIAARGEVGDGDPVLAVEDALREFAADEIVISTHPPGRSNWLERSVVAAVSERFDVPVTHVVVDLAREPAA